MLLISFSDANITTLFYSKYNYFILYMQTMVIMAEEWV